MDRIRVLPKTTSLDSALDTGEHAYHMRMCPNLEDSAGGRDDGVMLRVITSGGVPFAILADGPHGRLLLPPVVTDLAANVIEGRDELAWIVDCGLEVEIPMVRNCTPGELAAIDRRLAALRDELGARPWPPLDPRGDPCPAGGGLRGPIGRLRPQLGPEVQPPG